MIYRLPLATAWLGVLGVSLLAGGCRTARPAGEVPPTDPSPEALAFYGRGYLHEMSAEPDAAISAYLEAIALDPEHPAPYARAVAAHAAIGRQGWESPLPAALERLAGEHPGAVEPLRWMARLHRAAERVDDALAAYEVGLLRRPDDPGLHAERLALLVRERRMDEALEAARLAVRRRVAPRALVLPLGELYLRAGEDGPETVQAEALRLLQSLGSRAEADPELLLLLAELFRRGGAGEHAERVLDEARRLAPDLPQVYAQAALLRLAREAFGEARRVLAEGIAQVDRPLDLLRILAETATQHALRLEPEKPEAAAEAREEAIDAVRRLLDSVPRDTALRLRLSDLLILSGRLDEAVAELARVDPEDEQVRRQLAQRFLAAGASGDAIEPLREIAAEHPEDARIQMILGELLEQAGDRADALRAFARAARNKDAGPLPHVRRAALLAEDGALEAAMAAVDQGIEALGEQAVLVETGALLRLEAGRFDEAMAWLDRLRPLLAATGESPPPHLHVYRALVRQYTGESEEAADRLADAIDREALALEDYVHRAARLDRADETGARREVTRAVLRDLFERRPAEAVIPLYTGLYEHMAEAYARAVEAFDAAERVAEAHPDQADRLTPMFYFMYGAASERAGHHERAMERLARCIALDPDHAPALNYLAYMWADRNLHLDRALVYVRRALEHEPESGAYIDTLGWIYYRQGRFEEALTELQRALTHEPDEPTILDHVGDALRALGRPDEAIPYWLRSLEHGPENPEEIREKLREHGVDPPPDPDADAEAPTETERP